MPQNRKTEKGIFEKIPINQTTTESKMPTGQAKIIAKPLFKSPKTKNIIPSTIIVGNNGTIKIFTTKPTKETQPKL